MCGPRACLRRRWPGAWALSRGPGQCHPPSAGPGPRSPATGDGLCAGPWGRASLLVLLLLGQPCSAQRAGPRQRLGAAGRSLHLRGGCHSERGGLGTAPQLRVRAQSEPLPYPEQVPAPPGRADRRHFVRAEAAVASPSPGQPAAARPRSHPPSFPLSSPPSMSGPQRQPRGQARAQGPAGTRHGTGLPRVQVRGR